MVLFDNVKIGQKVEVRWKGRIVTGTVKYTGCLNGVRGEWVGVALDRPAGLHDGMIKGRRYFLCDDKHGIFTLASQIRFRQLSRRLYNSYRTVDPDSVVEYELFGESSAEPENAGWIVEGQAEKINGGRFLDTRDSLDTRRSYLRSQSVSRSLPPATWLRPQTARSNYMYKSQPYHYEYENDANDFIRSSTIPQYHMPHDALKRQVKLGWEKAPLVRYWSVHHGRDHIKHSQWNDISA